MSYLIMIKFSFPLALSTFKNNIAYSNSPEYKFIDKGMKNSHFIVNPIIFYDINIWV